MADDQIQVLPGTLCETHDVIVPTPLPRIPLIEHGQVPWPGLQDPSLLDAKLLARRLQAQPQMCAGWHHRLPLGQRLIIPLPEQGGSIGGRRQGLEPEP